MGKKAILFLTLSPRLFLSPLSPLQVRHYLSKLKSADVILSLNDCQIVTQTLLTCSSVDTLTLHNSDAKTRTAQGKSKYLISVILTQNRQRRHADALLHVLTPNANIHTKTHTQSTD